MSERDKRIARYEKKGYTKMTHNDNCPDCSIGPQYFTDKGFIVCANCGGRYKL